MCAARGITCELLQYLTHCLQMFVGMFEDDVSEVAWSKYLRKVSAVGECTYSILKEDLFDGTSKPKVWRNAFLTGHRCPDFEVILAKSFQESKASNPHQRVVLFMTHLCAYKAHCILIVLAVGTGL